MGDTDDWGAALERRYGKRCLHSAQSWYMSSDTSRERGCDDCDSEIERVRVKKVRPAAMTVWVQQWTEKGFGHTRCNYTLHLDRDDCETFNEELEEAGQWLHPPAQRPYQTRMSEADAEAVALMEDLMEDAPKYGMWGTRPTLPPREA